MTTHQQHHHHRQRCCPSLLVPARGVAVSLLLAACVLTLLVTSSAASSDGGKRFDCSVFCKSTGFSGVVGGCRCSFTLFTSKRAYMPGAHHHLRDSGGHRQPGGLLSGLFPRRLRSSAAAHAARWAGGPLLPTYTAPRYRLGGQ